ncbi:hypothetical protein PTKIN_Ptkin09bG0213000 [Pterospermum kingtungense]
MELSSTQAHLALLSSPAHLTPMVEIGKYLVTFHYVKVTIFVTSFLESAATVSRMVQSARSENLFDIIQLPPADISGLTDPAQEGIASVLAVARVTKQAFRSAISALETPPTALIVHVYAIDCLEIADEFKIPKFVFVCSNAWYLALIIYSPKLDKKFGVEFCDDDDPKKPFVLPGCSPVRAEDLPDPLLVQTKNNYLEFIRMAKEIPEADGFLVNTWEELQPTTLAALRDDKLLGSVISRAPIFPIGPVTADGAVGVSKNELIEWMNKQPKESVLYISFGSMGVLSVEQMTELAWGLELSQQRFIWVVRPPKAKTGVDFNPEFGVCNDMSIYLPEGFMSRTQERGLVVPHWASQLEILSHPSCGAFLTHCGWNSIIECITNGLPMIAWPLYAEQRMNATLITEELGVAVRSRTIPSKGVVGREEIETMVKKIFVDEEGRKIRGKVKELKRSAERAWTKGGSSCNALAEMVKQCTIWQKK